MTNRNDMTMAYNIKHCLEKFRKLIKLDGVVLIDQINEKKFTKATLQLDREASNLILVCNKLLSYQNIEENIINHYKNKFNSFVTHANDYKQKVKHEFAKPGSPHESHITGYLQVIYLITLEIKQCIDK